MRRVGKLTAQYEDRLATRERNTIKKQHTRNQIDRLVEDLITESMANGEFENLKGRHCNIPVVYISILTLIQALANPFPIELTTTPSQTSQLTKSIRSWLRLALLLSGLSFRRRSDYRRTR